MQTRTPSRDTGLRTSTRCHLEAEHDGEHEGLGLPQWPNQRLHWAPGDPREFTTNRIDKQAWED
jgi:hypothetical protein